MEAAVGAPAFVLLVGLIILGGRTAMTHQAVESAAADAARTASISRTGAEARSDAQQAARTSLSNQELHCLSMTVNVDTSDFTKQAGQPGKVTVTVACRLDLADLSVPGVPGSRVISAEMTSPLDTWRERS